MTRKFGPKPPLGGIGLHDAALTLTDSRLREEHTRAKAAWEAAGSPATALRYVRRSSAFGEWAGEQRRGPHPLSVAYVEAHKTLFASARQMLLSGALQAVAMEMGAIEAQYVEVLPLHWRMLGIRSWESSTAFRKPGPAPLYDVRIYSREDYDRAVSAASAEQPPGIVGHPRRTPTMADRIHAIHAQASEGTRSSWKTKSDAARWIRQTLDKKGDDKNARRHVQLVLRAELDAQFPDAPDGKTER